MREKEREVELLCALNGRMDGCFVLFTYPGVFASVQDTDAFCPDSSRVVNDVEDRL